MLSMFMFNVFQPIRHTGTVRWMRDASFIIIILFRGVTVNLISYFIYKSCPWIIMGINLAFSLCVPIQNARFLSIRGRMWLDVCRFCSLLIAKDLLPVVVADAKSRKFYGDAFVSGKKDVLRRMTCGNVRM